MSKKDFYIYLDGSAIRVSEDVDRAHYRGERKERYEPFPHTRTAKSIVKWIKAE